MDEITIHGEVILDWDDYNIKVIASREFVKEGKVNKEILRVGCFLDGEPLWGHVETLEVFRNLAMLKAFIGGTDDEPMVMIYDGGYGLSMMNLLSGSERWTMTVGNCNLGDAAAVAVDSQTGNMYIAGSEGPDPVAITREGRILWSSDPEDPEVFNPFEIILKNNEIRVKYRSGMTDGYIMITYDSSGEVIDRQQIME